MNNSLGLNFLRIVNEKGSNGWSQVYVRVPFDETELLTKGALFGSLYGKDGEDWADLEVEMMTWIDEYLNKTEIGGNLAGFFDEWKRKYGEITGVWLWINILENNKREVKIVKWGDCGVFLRKDEKNIDLTKNVEEGKVIKGSVGENDILYLWTDVLGEKILNNEEIKDEERMILSLSKDLVDENMAASGLILKIEKIISEDFSESLTKKRLLSVVEDVSESEMNRPAEENRVLIIDNKEDITPELVGDRYVGPLGMREKVANWWGSKFSSAKVIKVERDTSKRKKWAGILGFGFLVLLMLSVMVGSFKMKKDSEDKNWRNFYEPIEKNRQEAESLVKLNPVGARKLMEEVKTTFELRKVEFLSGRFKNDVVVLEKKINDSWVITSGESASNLEEILNVDLVRKGFVGDRMTITPQGKLLVADLTMGVAVSAEIITKDIRVVAGKIGQEMWVDISGEDKKTLIMTKTGIKNVELNKDVVTFDSAVSNPIALGRFMGNIYVLDSQNKEIYKYSALESGYGERSRWLKQGQTLGIVPVDMAIDADIWVVSESGQVEKYRRGVKESFSTGGIPSGTKINKIAVEVIGSRIALLDTTLGAIIICNKENGNCSQQLKSESLKTVRDLEFDVDGNLFVLLQGKMEKIK